MHEERRTQSDASRGTRTQLEWARTQHKAGRTQSFCAGLDRRGLVELGGPSQIYAYPHMHATRNFVVPHSYFDDV